MEERMTQLNAESWIKTLSAKLHAAFGPRLLFVGIQGSRARGEAGPQSDLDAVAVLDELTEGDLQTYKTLLDSLPHRDKACGFISGARELKNWPRQELFQFKHDTLCIYGSLEELLPPLTREDALNARQTGAGTIYHILCHTYLHGRVEDVLPACAKAAFFTLQARYFLQTGQYIRRKADLLPLLSGDERLILQASAPGEIQPPSKELFRLLFNWSARLLREGKGPNTK